MPHPFFVALGLAVAPLSPADTSETPRADVEVRQVVLRHATAVRRCYEDEGLRRSAGLEGTVELELTILPTGRVARTRVSATTLAGPGGDEVGRCMASAAKHWRFERGAYELTVVVFPFRFAPTASVTPRPVDEPRATS